MDIFGFTVTRKGIAQSQPSVVPPTEEGTIDVTVPGTGYTGYFGTALDLDGVARNDQEQIKRYRDIALMPDVDSAVEDIVNEAIAALENEDQVKLNLEATDLSDNIKKKVEEEFKTILKIMRFRMRGHDYFRRWYIDGRIHFHKVIDTKAPKDGIKEIRYIDSRKIRKIREILKERDPRTGTEIVKGTREYYIYDDSGMYMPKRPGMQPQPTSSAPLQIMPDAIAYAPSGLVDSERNMVLSYLNKAIKSANQLRMAENAALIYRLARAPERRIFYIDVGNLPKAKADQFLKDTMSKYRNKIVYDASTGEVRDDKKNMSVLEDFWLPRREGGKGTQIETLPGAQNLGEMGDIEYFRDLLYTSLNVPSSRLKESGGMNFGRASEITRDEMKFTKFVGKLRIRFSVLFLDLLRTQLLLKNVMTEDDWAELEPAIQFKYAEDAYYTESKQQEIQRSRLELLGLAAQFQGQFLSRKYIWTNIMQLTKEEQEQMLEEMGEEPPPLMLQGMGPGIPSGLPGGVAGPDAPTLPPQTPGPKPKGPQPAKPVDG
jgi:hypothetical protein